MSGPSISRINPATAPSTAEELMKLGIFQVRLLIEACGGLGDEPSKLAFAKMSTQEKVQLALQLLGQWRHANGMNGAAMMAPAPTAPAQQMPAPVQMAQPMQYAPPQGAVAEVHPSQLAAAQQMAVAQTAPVERTPSNAQTRAAKNGTSTGPDLGAAVLTGLVELQKSQAAIGEALAAMRKEQQETAAAFQGKIDGLEQKYAAIYNVLVSFDARLSALKTQSDLGVVLCLYLAENVIQGASREDILNAAISDMASVQTVLANAGK